MLVEMVVGEEKGVVRKTMRKGSMHRNCKELFSFCG